MSVFSFPDIAGVGRRSAGAAALVLCSAAMPASAANIFEAIFGGRRAPVATPSVYAPAPAFRELTIRASAERSRGNVSARNKKKPRKKSAATFAVVNPANGSGISSTFRPVIAKARPPVLPGPLGPFLMDSTLSRGDVVVTTAGLRIFAGGYSSRHSPSVFLPLARAHSYARGRMSLLAAIEETNRRGAPQISYRHYAEPASAVAGFVVLKPKSEHALLRPVAANGPALREPVTVSR